MKSKILDNTGKPVKEIDLPSQFSEPVREDLIKRAVLAIQANKRQPYGAYENAGKDYSARLSKRRRDYRGSYGRGISRVPRKVLLRRGRQFYYVGAVAPGTVGGRRAHPPKPEKIWKQKINKKERQKAIRSAIAATQDKELIEKRGHKFTNSLIIKDIENISKTKELKELLLKLGLEEEFKRIKKRIRAGKGKMRGRKYKVSKGPLIVTSQACPLTKAAQNLLGFDVITVESLNAELLAPGGIPGRLTIWSDKAIERLEKEKLFYPKENGTVQNN
jgi:large subunit ribosomal protein L4e